MIKRHPAGLALTLLFALAFSTSAQGGLVLNFPDPTGDTFGFLTPQLDIVNTQVTLTPTAIMFDVAFADMISAPSANLDNSVYGDIDLDIDQNPSTGSTSNVTLYGNQPSGLGIEYYVDLFSEYFDPGFVELVDVSGVSVPVSLPISFGTNSFSVTIPLSDLGGDDGYVNFGVIAGTFYESTDQQVGGVVPEPTSGLIWCCLAVAPLFGSGRRRRFFAAKGRSK